MTTQELNSIRVQSALDYVKRNLSEEISLKALAENSCCSLHHFHRIFRESTGLSLKDYIRCERLNHAVYDLMMSDRSVSEISLDLQYSSPEPFTRFFKKKFGMGPNEFRNTMSSMDLFEGVHLNGNFFSNHLDEQIRNPRVVIKREKTILGVKRRTIFSEACDFVYPPETWKEFFQNKYHLTIPNQVNPGHYYSVTYNWETSTNFDHLMGVEVKDLPLDDVPKGLELFTMPASKYLVFESTGVAPSVIDTWGDIVSFLGQVNYEVQHTHQVEYYGENWHEDLFKMGWEFTFGEGYWRAKLPRDKYASSTHGMEIWIPVIHKSELEPF